MKTAITTKTLTKITTWESEISRDVVAGIWMRVIKSSDVKTFQLMVCNIPSGSIFQRALVTWDELHAIRDMLNAVLDDTHTHTYSE